MIQGKRVLIIEDDEIVQKLVAKLVGRLGATVVVAATAHEIHALIGPDAPAFDLFLVDLILPDITGWEIMQLIRDNPPTAATPIVVLTGASLSETEKARILQTAQVVVEKKTFTLQLFDHLLNQWLK